MSNAKSQGLGAVYAQNKSRLEGQSHLTDATGTKHEGGIRSRHGAESSN